MPLVHSKSTLPVVAGIMIPIDSDGRYNLNALHKAHLAMNPTLHPNTKQPADWTKLESAKEFIRAVSNSEDLHGLEVIVSRSGRYGGTFAHELIAVEYAGWISVKFRIRVNQTFIDYRRGNLPDQDWRRLRHEAASSYKVMSDMLREVRSEQGKTTQPYHYANEAKLINWVITGEYKPVERGQLSMAELDLLAKLEARNAVLLGKGASRELRKELLTTVVERRAIANGSLH